MMQEKLLPKVIAAQRALTHIRNDIEIHALIEHVNYQFLESMVKM